MISAAALLMLSSMLYSLRLSSGSFPKPLSAEEEQAYLKRAAAGDLEARNILIERNLRLVAHIMKKYYAQTADQEDLISIGTIGLIKGISSFDPEKGARLATYAARCIENEILMSIRTSKKNKQEVSISLPIGTDKDGNEISLNDILGTDPDEIIDNLNLKFQIQALYRAIDQALTQREKQIILLRYGLEGQTPKTQREIASIMGISRSYVSRIEKKALSKLKDQLSQ